MSSSGRKIVDLEGLVRRRAALRDEGKIVVQCHGCFDIVHPGHIRYLRFARDQGDCLVVSVSADEFVGKGPDRPYIHEGLRAENLAELEMVDWVTIDRNSWAGPVLEAVQPDVYVKGKEYETSSDPRFAREKELVESYGGKVIYSSGEVVYSSTDIIGRFRDRFALDRDRVVGFCERHRLTREALGALVSRFSDLRILVLGDAILDQYVHCDVSHVAAESPVLDATLLDEEWFVGAAALIARQCVNFGARATLLTSIGDDAEAGRFLSGLERGKVETEVIDEAQRPVYVKTRYLAEGAKVFKANRGPYAPLSSVGARQLESRLAALAPDHDAVIATDFGYGMFSSGTAEAISSLPDAGTPYFLDVSQTSAASLLKFSQAACAMPTENELRLALSDHESGLSNLASRFYRMTRTERLTITMGRRGAVVFHPPAEGETRLESDYLPALARFPIDTVGAGDVFLSTAALGQLAGGSTAECLFLAACAAGLHVERLGNEPVTLPDLLEALDGRPELS